MYFGTVNAEATGAKYAYRKVTIDNLVLGTDDTLLFVENEPYVIKLALLGEDGLLTHLEYEGETEKQFVKADTFKLEQKNIDITLPEELAAGKYTLVAYISTADGIRSTAPDVFALGDIQSDSLISGAVEMRTSSDNGALAIEFRKSSTVSIALESEKPLSYSELYTLISEKAYEKGVIVKSGALIEGHNAAENKWTALDTEATEIGGGMYRIEYENKNADKVESGTIMITFGVAE
jgi:hypothetical protein